MDPPREAYGLQLSVVRQVCTGKMSWKVAPRSGAGVADSRPLCASTMEPQGPVVVLL
jgi:hypothetical protein